MDSSCNLTANEPERKLLVSAKSWDGRYDANKQVDGFSPCDRIGKVIFSTPWSPIIFKNGYREEKNFISSDWLVLDYDEHTLPAEQAAKVFADYQNIISFTKSHTDQRHCLRVCIPWAERINDVKVFNYNFTKNADFYESDKRALNGARFFWPSKKLHSINLEGERMEVLPAFETEDDFEFIQLNNPNPEERELPFYYEKYLREGLNHLDGGRNQKLWGLSKDLFEEGWNENEVLELISRVNCRPKYRSRDYEKCVYSAKKAFKKEKRPRS